MSLFKNLYVNDDLTVNGNTITASGNITATAGLITGGTITSTGLLTASADLSVAGNATITGDLTVNGTTTTVSSQNLNITDSHIYVNKDNTSTTGQTGGIVTSCKKVAASNVTDTLTGAPGAGSTAATTSAANFASYVGYKIRLVGNSTEDGVYTVVGHAGNVLTVEETFAGTGDANGTFTLAASDTLSGNGFDTTTTIITTTANLFATHDIIQITGATDSSNNGIFVVASHIGTTLTILTTAGDFYQTALIGDDTTAGTITHVDVAVLESNATCVWQAKNGANTDQTSFTAKTILLSGDSASNSTLNLTADSNQLVLDSDGNDATISSTQSAGSRTFTIPDTASDTFVMINATQNLANKTLVTPNIRDSGNDHNYVFAVSELTDNRTVTLPLLGSNDTFVFESHTQDLSNKTMILPRIADTSNDHDYVFAVSELTDNRTVTLPLLTGNDTFVFETHSQDLSNKTLITPRIGDTSNDHDYIFAVSELLADRTVTLPLLTTNDTFVFEGHAQSLSGKTLVLPKIADTSADHDYEFAVSELAANRTVTLPLLTTNDTFVFEAHSQDLSNKTLIAPRIGDTSNDHDYIFAVNELTADRTVTMPLLINNDTFVFETHSQDLSNKTLITPRIGDTSNDHDYIFAVNELAADRTVTLPLLTVNDTFVFEAHTQDLSNKTLLAPKIADTSNDHDYIFAVNELAADRTVTLPLLTGNDTFVFESHTQTLSNKTVVVEIANHVDTSPLAAALRPLNTFVPTANRTATLPGVAASTGYTYKFAKIGGGAFTITINEDAGDTNTIEGDASIVLDTVGQHTSLTSDGVSWHVNW